MAWRISTEVAATLNQILIKYRKATYLNQFESEVIDRRLSPLICIFYQLFIIEYLRN